MFEDLKDYVEIKCKFCCSLDVDLLFSECAKCGNHIDSRCNTCKKEFKHHDFKEKKDD